MKQTGIVIAVFWALLSSACLDSTGQATKQLRDSAIVKEVVTAGAGDPLGYTEPGLEAWFSRRPAFAGQVFVKCSSVKATADGLWMNTPEGMICSSVQNVMALQFPTPLGPGGRGW